GWDQASGIAIDGSGNVYVTGSSQGSGTGFDYATIKYDSSGNEQWVARYNGPGNGTDEASAIAIDGSGNIYVTGFSDGSGNGVDYATIKYDSSGNEQWVARYNGPGNSVDAATAIAVDGSGNTYVTGHSRGLGSCNFSCSDYATIKYQNSGTQEWVARYNGPGNGDDEGDFIAVDSSGNVYVAGLSTGSGTGWDYATIKYNASGVQQWVTRYNGPAGGNDAPNGMAIDAAGNVYVTGNSLGIGTGYDYATVKYNSSGTQQWVTRYNGPGNLDDVAQAMAVDLSGNAYVTGKSQSSNGDTDYATIKYSASGAEQWVARYKGPGNSEDIATAIALDGSGNVVVTGYST